MWTEPTRHKRNLVGHVGDHRPKPAIWFLALPFLIVLAVLRPVGCGFVWFGRFLRWLVRPKTLLGLAFLLPWVVVFHVIWFAHGWSAFRPLCWHDEGYPRVELMGPMTVEAADKFYNSFTNWLGPDSVRRVGANRIDVRPALRMIPTGYFWNVTSHVARAIADRHGLPNRFERELSDCAFSEDMLMQAGKASGYSEGWGYWPYNEIEEFSPLGNYLVFYHCSDRPPRC